jgi:hypothetical protein
MILIEINPPTLARQGVMPEDLIKHLQGYGYALYVANRKRLVKLKDPPCGEDYVDVICIYGGGERETRGDGRGSV